MATFVLVHGGSKGGWIYGRVARLLREAGHVVYAPSLSGLGDRKHLLSSDIGLDTHITDIVNLLEYEDLTDVTLAGHSYGGMVITGVADRVGHRISHLVYLDAAHPKNGEALAEMSPIMEEARKGGRVIDGVELVVFPDSLSVRHMGVTDPDDYAWQISKMTPTPWKCFSQPIVLKDEAAIRRIHRTNVICMPGVMDRDEEAWRVLRDAELVFEIETGHNLMITEPRKTADFLLAAAAARP